MTNDQENLGAQRTRRNIVKAAPILASAVAVSLATTRTAFGGNDKGNNGTAMAMAATTTVRIVS
jgi:hypothetical protein